MKKAAPKPQKTKQPTLPVPLMQPMNDRVLVDRDPLPLVSEGGLHVPESSLVDPKKLHAGRLLAIGPRVDEAHPAIPADDRLQVGDRVWFRITAGLEFTADDGTKQILLKGGDLFAHEHQPSHR